MSKERQEQLQLKLNDPLQMDSEESIGIKNVHDRITYYYGESYGMTITSEEHVGTTITLLFPLNIQMDGVERHN